MHLPRPDWTRFSTLRARLTLWNTGVVLLMTVASLVAARLAAQATLYDDADAELRAGAMEIVLAIQDLSPDVSGAIAEMQRMVRSHEERGWFVHLLTEDGATVWKSDHCPDAVAAFPPSNLGEAENIRQVGPFRYVRRLIAQPGQPVYHVRVGTYTTGLDERLTALVRQLTLVDGALLLVTPAVGWWLARRATRPIAEILGTAERLRPTRLGDRLPVHGTRDELDRLSLTINRLLDQVAGHVADQERFVADAAHELRGPLAAVQSTLEVAVAKDRPAGDYRQAITEVLDESRQLSRLTNDLLLLAEGQAETLGDATSEVDLAGVVRSTESMFAGPAEERGITLAAVAPTAALVRGESRALRQVVSNLVDNAIRFTPPGGTVRISLAVDGAARQAVLAVHDTGRGIEERHVPRVFDRFFQADEARDRRDTTRGGGLGLPICRAIVERLGGSIAVTSRPGAGSTFTVRLPLSRS